MSCKDCTGDCRQGRDCPNDRPINLTQYHFRFYNLIQTIKKWFNK
jgi:hypothetical protein